MKAKAQAPRRRRISPQIKPRTISSPEKDPNGAPEGASPEAPFSAEEGDLYNSSWQGSNPSVWISPRLPKAVLPPRLPEAVPPPRLPEAG